MASANQVTVANATFDIPQEWSYSVSRQPEDAWGFEMSARHPFNRRVDYCDTEMGPLGPLLSFEKAFVVGSVSRSQFAPGATVQRAGELRLDRETFGPSEGTGCRSMFEMNFELDGYYFAVHAAISGDAGPEIRREVLAVLNSAVATRAEESSPSPFPSRLSSRSKSWRKDRYISVDEAVQRLQPHVDVSVVLPQDKAAGLPSLEGWLADPKYLDWRTEEGLRIGELRLIKGRQILLLSYGLAGFDGCGGRDHAIETEVLGQPALVSQASGHLWSQIIWPVTETGSTGRYDITGTFGGWQMVRFAESMELARLEAMEASKGC